MKKGPGFSHIFRIWYLCNLSICSQQQMCLQCKAKILKSCSSFRQPRTTTQWTATELCASSLVTTGASFGSKKWVISLHSCFRIPLKDNLTTFPASALYYFASTDLGEDRDNKEPVLKYLSRIIQKSSNKNKSRSCCTHSQQVHLWRQHMEERSSL